MYLSTLIFYIFVIQEILSHQLLYEGDKCLINGTISGKCKRLNDCASAKESLRKGVKPQNCGFNDFTPIVCCETHEYATTEQMSTAKEKCELYTKIKNRQEQVFFISVVGGVDANPGEFKHMAALGYGPPDDKKWFCGGSLISNNYVLTAGHCVETSYGKVNTVRLGDYKLDGSSGTHRDYEVIGYVIHPKYKPPSTYHDIALLNLDRYVEFSSSILPACLPTELLFSKQIQATGWGLTNFGGNPSNILQKVDLDLFTLQECNQVYKNNTRKLLEGIKNDIQICAGSRDEEKDTCQGDSGGPLQYKNDALHTIIGVTSFGKACGTPGVPGIYTNVHHYVGWIVSNIWT